MRKVRLSLEDIFGEFEILWICFGEKDMEMTLEFKESGTLFGRGEFENLRICFGEEYMKMTLGCKESRTLDLWKMFWGSLKF